MNSPRHEICRISPHVNSNTMLHGAIFCKFRLLSYETDNFYDKHLRSRTELLSYKKMDFIKTNFRKNITQIPPYWFETKEKILWSGLLKIFSKYIANAHLTSWFFRTGSFKNTPSEKDTFIFDEWKERKKQGKLHNTSYALFSAFHLLAK